MSKDEVLERVITLLATMSDVEEIDEDSEIMEDLDLSSMDVLFLVSSIEAEFRIKMPEKEIRRVETVGDIADVIVDCL